MTSFASGPICVLISAKIINFELQLWARSIAARWQMRQKTKSRVLAAAIAAKRQNQIAAVIVVQKYERRRQKQWEYFDLLAVL